MTTTTTNNNKIKPTKKHKITTGTLEKIFTNNIEARILDFLITYQENDYSKNDISKYSGVSWRLTLKAIKHLEQTELITHTRNVSLAHMYKYNTQNKAAQLLNNFTNTYACTRYQKTIDGEIQKEKENPTPTIEEEAGQTCLVHDCTHNKNKSCNTRPKMKGDICQSYIDTSTDNDEN